MSLVLRDYQHDLIARARAALRGGSRRVLIQAPTGSGKTCLVAHLLAAAVAKGKRAWFIVHRKELLDQSVTTFIEAADIHTGVVAAGYPRAQHAPVQVCSVLSLARRHSTLLPPDLLVWDEAHHLASKSWTAIAQAFPAAIHLGLTATPQRLDGRGLGTFFDTLLCGPTTAELIAAGYLAPYRFYAPGAVSLDGVHRVAGDFNKQEVADVLDASTVVGDCVHHYLAHTRGGRALVFTYSLDASRQLATQFQAAQVPAAHVDGETLRGERTTAMRQFRSGELRVLCNVDLFGEGLDVPAVDAVFLLRPTQSLGLYLQQVGRGLRPNAGKSHVKIFDHVGNWTRHGLPHWAREWSLSGHAGRTRETDAPMGKRCGSCFGVARPGASVCPYCGVAFVVKTRDVAHVDGTLVETNLDDLRLLRAAARDDFAQCQTLRDWQALARKLHYKPGWAWHRYEVRRQRKSAATTPLDTQQSRVNFTFHL